MGGDTDMSAKLLHLETEVSAKKGEINALKEQVSRFTHFITNQSCIQILLLAYNL